MPEDQTAQPQKRKKIRLPRISQQTLVLWVLFLGLVVSFAANVLQDRKIDGLAQDFDMVRQGTQKQIALLHEAQSAALEQDLLRLDQLNTQMQKITEDQRQQEVAIANRTRSELAKTVEQRHQEMITAISDLRADLRSEADARATQLNQLSKADSDQTASGPVDTSKIAPVDDSATTTASAASEQKDSDDQSNPSATPKKGFWSKLNPFSRNKK